MENLKIISEKATSNKLVSDKPIEIYTISSAAKSLGVSKGLLNKGIEDGTLKYVKNGSRTYVTAKALENFFQCCREYL